MLKDFFKSIWNSILKSLTQSSVTKPQQNKPVDSPPPVHQEYNGEVPHGRMMTRDEYISVKKALMEGKLKSAPYGNYVNWREDAGNKNKSKLISPMVLRQGGDPGQPYCQYGQQDGMDGMAYVTGIPRHKWAYPEGGGTQKVFNKTPDKYKSKTAKPGSFVTVVYNGTGKDTDSGHIEDMFEIYAGGQRSYNFGFNTNIDGDDSIVRDGQGAGWVTRPLFETMKQGKDIVTLRGYTDHYLIYQDAYKAHFG